MDCVNCGKLLSELRVDDLTVDVCGEGCGGVWFDAAELKKVDEKAEGHGEKLLKGLPAAGSSRRNSEKGRCPRCGVGLRRYFFSPAKTFEIDECAQCGGVWLDGGELAALRDLPGSEEERRTAARNQFDAMFRTELGALASQTQNDSDRAHRFARAVRWVLPSTWLPGKQKGGAF
ncbi:MAG: zf-TFIIB domain-containing protein [Elusimicrobia bacterium]|nr:zf-TFIIB domain-containing protein [Elusimicrobiota bacterium]MBK7689287.1 zf-TFIIB domain-containing protein [Elusimicrobiota bacterium]MBK9694143.1 zf-TFIIB domain-containing protein [Elusimicrobiota bacterium]MBL0360156.1 zf-TFIIB domain-containing protein [Elusimicrobiota bacterium]MBP8004054.1 zf-TFIIB domain-containing protein [Elusimicrobiota bacterium]